MKILLVEDQALVRGALKALLELEPDVGVIREAEDGERAKELLAGTEQFDLVLTDIQMPRCDGLELCRHITEAYPEIPVLILTTFARAGYLQRALDVGASGFMLKDAPPERLAIAIRDVISGRKVIDSELALSAMGNRLDPLSIKERKALSLARDGVETADIAKRLCLSEGTVRNYLSEAMSKLGAKNRVEAARIAADQGWI